ncbi:MAG: gliding motility protein GldL [Bacteroidetes bacterium]|nr:gliding motility protein GldL [Bacteroidota bacterium]
MGAKKGGLGAWMATPKGRKVMGYLFGIGAAIVILGALFKIMHWPFCNQMLIAGLGTEAVLFTLTSFQISHPEPDWSIYYPYAYPENERHRNYVEKGGNVVKWDSDDSNPLAISGGGNETTDTAEIIAKMMEKAKIDQALLERLGNAMRDLSKNVEGLSDSTSVIGANQQYIDSLHQAAASITKLSSSYEVASQKVSDIVVDAHGVQDFGTQMTNAANNLKELNASLAGVGSLQTVMTSLAESAEDTKSYANNMKTLAKNLEDLNSVYGNMLRAMGK